jgi:hypothetical protein
MGEEAGSDRGRGSWITPAGVTTFALLALLAAAVWQSGLPEHITLPGGISLDFSKQWAPAALTRAGLAKDISRKTFAGRWQVQQNLGQVSGATFMDWHENGTFEGTFQQFINATGQGQQLTRSGTWDLVRLASDQFRLEADFSDDEHWTGTFQVLGPDKIHNIDQNYVAIRIPH